MKVSVLPSRTLKSVALGQHIADQFLALFIEPLKSKDVIMSIAQKMEDELKNVLSGRKSVLKKSHTFIQDFPDGKEKGDFLGIHFEAGLINMAGIKVDRLRTLQSIQETVVVPEEERLLRGTERVHFVARALKHFSRRIRMIEVPDIDNTWNIGVNHGYLEVEGRDGLTSLHSRSWPDEYNFTGKPVRMLNLGKQIMDAADSIGFNLDIKGFLHTPEAVFLDGVWKHPETIGSLALEHRCASCIKARTSDVSKLSYKDEEKPYILLKICWESFGDNGEMDAVLNDFDREVDLASETPGKNVFEKIVSEEYIIKLVRMVLLALSDEGHIFKSNEINRTRLKTYLQEVSHSISTMSRSYSRGMWDQLIRTFRFESLDVKESFIISRVVEVISWRATLMLGIILSTYIRTSTLGGRQSFMINGTHTANEMHEISSAVDHLLSLQGAVRGSTGRLQFSTQSQVFGAAVLAAINTKNPFDYDEDYSQHSTF